MSELFIKQILARLDRLEKAVMAKRSNITKEKEQESSSPGSLPAQILKLRNRGFFKEPRVAGEVHGKLKPTYHCALNRVVMALLRLQRRKDLRKTSKMVGRKKQVAYVW